jgi:hypothetical protein
VSIRATSFLGWLELTRTCACNAGDRLFTLDIRSDSFASVSIALGVLQEELPAETSFYLPEAYHRKIIGRNGKNIQEIMYRHNVAVRFSSSEQWADFGGHQGLSRLSVMPQFTC